MLWISKFNHRFRGPAVDWWQTDPVLSHSFLANTYIHKNSHHTWPEMENFVKLIRVKLFETVGDVLMRPETLRNSDSRFWHFSRQAWNAHALQICRGTGGYILNVKEIVLLRYAAKCCPNFSRLDACCCGLGEKGLAEWRRGGEKNEVHVLYIQGCRLKLKLMVRWVHYALYFDWVATL